MVAIDGLCFLFFFVRIRRILHSNNTYLWIGCFDSTHARTHATYKSASQMLMGRSTEIATLIVMICYGPGFALLE